MVISFIYREKIAQACCIPIQVFYLFNTGITLITGPWFKSILEIVHIKEVLHDISEDKQT